MELNSTKIPIEILSVKAEGYHCFIRVMINNEFPLRMILDTGASRTVLDLNFAGQSPLKEYMESTEEMATGLGTNSMQGHTLNLDSLKIGNIVLEYYMVGILDLQHVNETYRMLEMPEIQGAVGSDILYLLNANINYRKKILTLSDCKNDTDKRRRGFHIF